MSTAALDCLFSMIKFVSMGQDISGNKPMKSTSLYETARESLWLQSWNILTIISCYDLYNGDLSLQFCQNLSSLYTFCCDGEFRYSRNISNLLRLITIAPRQQYPSFDDAKNVSHVQGPNDWQMYRCILDLLKKIRTNHATDFAAITSAVSDICFGNRVLVVERSETSQSSYLGPCPLRLRSEVSQMFLLSDSVEASEARPLNQTYSQQHFEQMLQIVAERFIANIFSASIENKIKAASVTVTNQGIEHTRVNNASAIAYPSFFSAIKTFLTSLDNSVNHSIESHAVEVQNTRSSDNFYFKIARFELAKGDVWVPVHLLTELKSYATILFEFAKSYKLSSIKSWLYLKRVLLVILSPWKYDELYVLDYNLTSFGFGDSEESSAIIASILNTFFFGICDNQ